MEGIQEEMEEDSKEEDQGSFVTTCPSDGPGQSVPPNPHPSTSGAAVGASSAGKSATASAFATAFAVSASIQSSSDLYAESPEEGAAAAAAAAAAVDDDDDDETRARSIRLDFIRDKIKPLSIVMVVRTPYYQGCNNQGKG